MLLLVCGSVCNDLVSLYGEISAVFIVFVMEYTSCCLNLEEKIALFCFFSVIELNFSVIFLETWNEDSFHE